MAEALIQSAVKRALEQSLNGTSNLTSTQVKNSQDATPKRTKMDVSLDESIVSSANEYSDLIDGAVENIDSGEKSVKNKKVAEAVLKQMKAELIKAVNKALELFFQDIAQQINSKMDSVKGAIQRSYLPTI